MMPFIFFFQAEDGIRDLTVTGVQTCALPISVKLALVPLNFTGSTAVLFNGTSASFTVGSPTTITATEIGRASCRERVEISVVAVSLKKKKERNDNVRRDRDIHLNGATVRCSS